MSAWFNVDATAKILVFGMLAGAALPALFALGVRLHAAGSALTEAGPSTTRRRAVLGTLGWAIYALLVVMIVVAVLFIARDFIGHHTGWYILGAKPG